MKIIIGFLLGIAVCLTCSFTPPQSKPSEMIVRKYKCDCNKYPDCQTDIYQIDAYVQYKSKTVWRFVNNYGNTVIVELR